MTWKLQTPLATLQCGPLRGQVDVARPQLGVHVLRRDDAPLDGIICRVERDATSDSSSNAWPAQLADAYVRGSDLIANYQATKKWPFAPQIYWQAAAPESMQDAMGALSLLVSVSTHLLDTFPRICISTQLPADEVLLLTSIDDETQTSTLTGRQESVLAPAAGASCLLWRLPGGALSYAEIMPANDFRQLTVRPGENGMCESRWELFSEFLEKGVIRRARLQSAFVPRHNDAELAAAYSRQISARPLPLTT
jgi:hypothetical protein